MNRPFVAPAGYAWLFVTRFYYVRAKRYLYAKDYGLKAWRLLVKLKKGG